jgi:hypothetical protein
MLAVRRVGIADEVAREGKLGRVQADDARPEEAGSHLPRDPEEIEAARNGVLRQGEVQGPYEA